NAGTKSLATERLSISVLSAANVVLPHTDYVGIFNGTRKHLRQKQKNKLDINQISNHALYHQQTKRRLSQKLVLSSSDAGAAPRYSIIGMTCICTAGGNTLTSTVGPYSLDHGAVMK
ncbi:MAG: hypothetical protein AB2792_20105, partial [Candidatus Thiodiazotropha sp.]